LFDIFDTNRINDIDPIKINKINRDSINFRFNLDSIRSPNESVNATTVNFFTNFINSLPTNSDDKIKLLITLLSKELRISKGLTKPEIKRILRDEFQTNNSGNP